MERWGLRQVTNGSGYPFGPLVEGELVTWQTAADPTNSSTPLGDIVGFNITRGRLILIGWGPTYHQTLNFQSHGRVVFAEEPFPGALGGPRPAYLVLVDTHSMTRRILDTGLGGEAVPSAFDDSWVLFRNRGGPNASQNDGLWALNVDDGRKLKLYTPVPEANGVSEVLWGEAVVDGTAYFGVNWAVANPRLDMFELYATDLGTGNRSVFLHRDGPQLHRISASKCCVVWEELRSISDVQVWYSNRTVANPVRVSTPEDGQGTSTQAGGGWLAYLNQDRDLVGYEVASGQRRTLFENNPNLYIGPPATDGKRVSMAVTRASSDLFESIGSDLYWLPLSGARN